MTMTKTKMTIMTTMMNGDEDDAFLDLGVVGVYRLDLLQPLVEHRVALESVSTHLTRLNLNTHTRSRVDHERQQTNTHTDKHTHIHTYTHKQQVVASFASRLSPAGSHTARNTP